MATKTTAVLKEDLSFEMELQGHTFMVDSDEEFGGKNRGPRPKSLLLSGLAGCTGMDVASILRKMQMPFDSLSLEVEGEQNDEHPMVYTSITVRYILTGSELERDKIEKAVKLSQTRYCGVTAMLEKTADINWEVVLNP